MASHRVYRAAMPLEKVEAEIQRCTGTQFDPHCVEALMEIGLREVLGSVLKAGGEMALTVKTDGLRRV